jgi:hypothetical protein
MRINEIITESTELEEGWKSKVGAAALAGAAMLGGGHQDAQAQNYQPTAQSQQVKKQSDLIYSLQDGVAFGILGELKAYKDAGLLSPAQLNFYNKMFDMFMIQYDINPFFKNNEKYYNSLYNRKLGSAKDIINKMGVQNLKGPRASNLRGLLDAPFKILKQVEERVNGELLQKQKQAELGAKNAATPSKYGDTVVGQAKPLSAQDQKFYDSFNADLTKVSRTLDQIRASKPTREKMEAARQDLARVIPQYDSTLNQAISRGFDKAAGQTFKLKIDNLKRIAGIPLNQK